MQIISIYFCISFCFLFWNEPDVIQAKQHHDLITGVTTFNKAKLKRTNTKEKIVLPTKEGFI